MYAANPTFARIGSRISFDMLKSLRRASVFYFPKPKIQKPKNPKNLNFRSLAALGRQHRVLLKGAGNGVHYYFL